jgi:outer membrane lipoprotein SlyB
MIAGAVMVNLLPGSLIGGGSGRTVATVVGALGAAYAGSQIERSQSQMVYPIGIKYDAGTWATIRQTAPTGLRSGERARVTDHGVELLR